MSSTDKPCAPGLCTNAHGFSLDAAVRRGADQREQLEHLCRYITGPATANQTVLSNSNNPQFYFFSPGDESAVKDVAVLNKIWREGRLGVVGIPVGGKDEEVGNYVNEAKPLFPIRRSDAEVKLVKPVETPDLYLDLPLAKKMFRLGPTISETAIAQAIRNVFAAQTARNVP